MYTTYAPIKELQPYVNSFFSFSWKKKSPEDSISELCLPSGCGFMGFQIAGRCKIIMGDRNITVPKFYTVGQQTSKYNITSDNKLLIVTGAVIQPTGLWHLFGLNMAAIVNNDIDTCSLFEDGLRSFTREYCSIKDSNLRVKLIEKLLLSRLVKVTPKLNMIDVAVSLIHKKMGCVRIKDIANQLNVSERYFQKRFRMMVGIVPSAYCRIIRFNYLFAGMGPNGTRDDKALSILSNYYDFPHFSKDFKKYCGAPPSKFHIEQFQFLKDYMVDQPMVVVQ